MTIQEAIAQVDELRPNTYGTPQKVEWLRRCESMILRTVLCRQENPPTLFDKDAGMDTELTVPEPWCSLYVHWLEAQTHYANGEYERYNNAITMFNDALGGYRGEAARTGAADRPSRFRF